MSSTPGARSLPERIAVLKDRFRPSSPVDKQDLFKGRLAQLSQVFAAVQELGQHAVIYGERGVGKTSIAYMAKALFGGSSAEGARLGVRFQCSADDSFATVWQKFPLAVQHEADLLAAGPGEIVTAATSRAAELLAADEITPDRVFRAINVIARHVPMLLIIDEFDRIGDIGSSQLFADIVKTLSDSLVPCTLLLVGVADDVDGLIQGHRSVERALKQVHMPRMEPSELEAILDEGYAAVGLTVTEVARTVVVRLSQGLPHYTHLLGGILGELALLKDATTISPDLLGVAIERAIAEAQRSIQVTYAEAISSPHKSAGFADTLLACAMAEVDHLGYFAPVDVSGPLSRISGTTRETPAYLHHLRAFNDDPRGYVLETRGEGRGRRYRFNNPLLQPFVLLKGVVDGRISVDDVATEYK